MEIDINDPEINVQKIMEQIRESIRKRNYDGEADFSQLEKPLSANQHPQADASMDELLKEQAIINRVWSYSADYHLTSHRKIIGKFIVFGKKVVRKCLRWYMNPVVDHQVQFNATAVRMLNQLVQLVTWLKNEQAKAKEAFRQLQTQLVQLEKNQFQLKERQTHFENEIKAEISAEKEALTKSAETNIQVAKDSLKDSLFDEVSKLRTEIMEQLARNTREMDQIKSSMDVANSRLRRIERQLKGRPQQEESVAVTSRSSEEPLDFDYYLFEEYYRGSRKEIMERQRQYLRYFSQGQFVLDLGCGRGEFLELLATHGVHAEGVEINDDMIAYCRERGFTVHKADLLEYLETVEDNSVDGIFLGQVIEHLTPRQLIRLIQLSHAKLKPRGYFIAETPNPRSLSIFAQSFYMDLTHTKPVHPYTAKFLLESEGFRDIEIHYFSPNSETLKLPELATGGSEHEELNKLIDTLKRWHEFIFGDQDYYILGRK
jgi:O-antigen chain-terminating methyltransferase